MHVDEAGDSGSHLSPPDTGDRNGKGDTGAEALRCKDRPILPPISFPISDLKMVLILKTENRHFYPHSSIHTYAPLKFTHSQCKSSNSQISPFI